MQKFIQILFIGIVISTVTSSCNTGKNLYTNGNYYEAVIRSVEKLRKSPNNKKAMETLANAYPHAVNTLLDQLENKQESQSDFINTKAVAIYGQLNRMYENIERSPAAKNIINNPKKFYTQLRLAKANAAEEQYKAGVQELSLNNRQHAKQAYFYFLEADKFVKNYKDVPEKMEEAYHLSLLHVLANFKPIQSRTYDLSADLFYSEVKKILNQIETKEFVRFYTPEQSKEIGMDRPDQILQINFEDFVVGETHTKERIEKMKRDSLKVGQVTLEDGTKRDVIGSVEAKVSINRMEVVSRGLVNLTIKQKEGQQELIKEDFGGEYIWFNEWGNYNGDKRALNEAQLNICHNKRINPLAPQQMFVEFTKPIHSQLRQKLFNFYKNY